MINRGKHDAECEYLYGKTFNECMSDLSTGWDGEKGQYVRKQDMLEELLGAKPGERLIFSRFTKGK